MDQKSFWTTLPGILTGVASLITACVGMLTIFIHKSSDVPPKAATAVYSSSQARVAVNNVGRSQGCEEMVGRWSWFIGGVVVFSPDGTLAWKKDSADAFPAAGGIWNCVDAKTNKATLSWPTGFVDTVTLSSDGKSVSGTTTASPDVKITGWRL